MECEDESDLNIFKGIDEDVQLAAAVNSSILDYYKKFGRKRDLEQYFSLSTAQNEIRDPNSSFWRSMKYQNDSSDSGERKSESSKELCRISIKCTVPEPSTSQEENSKRTPDSDSPPIITEDGDAASKLSADERKKSEKSDDEHSQKSGDATFDTSMNKPLSPTSSVTSQRKLEWDSLADVGYGNESGRKTSGSSLSTLERLALKQQYSNNDSKELGQPTAHSTLLDETGDRVKQKRQLNKLTKIHRKDIDLIEVNMPHSSKKTSPQAINVNLTKHISFNMDKAGGITIGEHSSKVNPEKVSVQTGITPLGKTDRESQTSFKKTSDCGSTTEVHSNSVAEPLVPVPLNLNTLRRRNRKKRALRRKSKTRVKSRANKENEPVKQKSVDQVSEAESFEYMPGHIYNQNQQRQKEAKASSAVGNKSSLESSGNATTDSGKISKASFTRDLEKCVKLLKDVLKSQCDDEILKKKLIKSVVQRLLESQYKDDETSSDFLSGLSRSSRKLDIVDLQHTTTSTSDTTTEKIPKKSILRVDKFNPNVIASTSQSAPNLPVVSSQDVPVILKLVKQNVTSTTESDSGKEKTAKASSEELYRKYLEALKREAAYKQHLKDKEALLKHKLVASENSLQPEARVHNRIKELMKDLTRNNYDDGSGDASKLEGGSNSYSNTQEHGLSRNQRSHSVFTLNSSGASGSQKHKWNLKKKLKHEMRHNDAENSGNADHSSTSSSKGIYYKVEVCDSSVQVDIPCLHENNEVALEPIGESPKNIAHIVSDEATGDVKYVCLCPSDSINNKASPENILIYKCSRLSNAQQASTDSDQALDQTVSKDPETYNPTTSKQPDHATYKFKEKSSQTDVNSRPISPLQLQPEKKNSISLISPNVIGIEEATRCLQTEISINPTLSEPTLSDINFIKEDECAILVSEHYKIPKGITELQCEDGSRQSLTGTSKMGINKYLQEEQNSQPETSSGYTQAYRNSNNRDPFSIRTISNPSFDTVPTNNQVINTFPPEHRQDNIAIPIEGTNMTLMVTFSADVRPDTGVQSQGTVTQKPDVSEKATSLFEECTKSVQSRNTGLFKEMDKLTLHNADRVDDIINNMHNKHIPKYDTHPKMTQITDKKHFFRSNTDPINLDKISADLLNHHTNIVVSRAEQYPNPKTPTQCCTPEMTPKCESSKKESSSPKSKSRQSSSHVKPDYNPCSSCFETPVPSNQNSYNFFKKEEMSSYLKMFAKKAGAKKTWIVKSPMQKGFWRKKQRNKDSLEDLREPILDMIKVITKRFSKSCIENNERKRLKDIINTLSYLLDTDESGNVPDASCSRSETRHSSCNTSRASLRKSVSKLAETLDKKYDKSPVCKMVISETQLNSSPHQTVNILDPNQHYDQNNHKSCSAADCKYCNAMKKLGMQIQTDDNELQSEPLYQCGKINCGRLDCKVCNVNLVNTKNGTETDFSGTLESEKRIKKTRSKQHQQKLEDRPKRKTIQPLPDIPLGEDLVLKIRCKKTRKTTHARKISDAQANEQQTTEKNEDHSNSSKNTDKTTPRKHKSSQPTTYCFEQDVPKLPGGIRSSTDDINSTDSATCKLLAKIQKQCDKYHQKRCGACHYKCNATSSNPSSACSACKRIHYCYSNSKGHKYKKNQAEVVKKKGIAYNLILQASDSISEDTLSEKQVKQLKNIIVKVPSRSRRMEILPFNEVSSKIEKNLPQVLSYEELTPDSRCVPSDAASSSDGQTKRTDVFTVRNYLEKNRPKFVDKSTQRQNCIKLISEKRASQREAQRRLLSLHVDNREALSNLSIQELRMLAEELGIDMRKKDKPKFICEKEMKKHSEKIYKSLPEVTTKKEQQKKENIKKTNLLMADIFKRNLQKRTLQGNVNLSNYSSVLKL